MGALNMTTSHTLGLGLAALLLAACAQATPPSYQWHENGATRHGWLDIQNGIDTSSGQAVQKPYPTTSRSKSALGLPRDSKLLPIVRLGPAGDAPYLVPAGGVIVQSTDPAALQAWASKRQLNASPAGIDGYWRINTAPGNDSLEAATALASLPGVQSASPDWSRLRQRR